MTTRPTEAPPQLRAGVDPLHRNTWPVRVGDDPTSRVVGYLTEHITVTLDGVGAPPPPPSWSWTLDLAEFGGGELSRGPRYASWSDALESLAGVYRALVAAWSAQSEVKS